MTDSEELKAMDNINRLEVIDQTGRAYVHYLNDNESVRYKIIDKHLKYLLLKNQTNNTKTFNIRKFKNANV